MTTKETTVVMVGAGQLARMTHQAAIDYGITLHVLAEHGTDPAVLAGAPHTLGRPDVLEDLAAAASYGSVVTLDHELVSADALDALVRGGVTVRPGPDALRLAQDKLAARTTLAAIGGFPLPAFAPAADVEAVAAFANEHGWPVVVKARRGGYDGRGVHVVASLEEASAVLPWSSDEPDFLVEEYLDLAGEFAILLARRPSGEIATYPPIATLQVDGICNELTMPAALAPEVMADAVAIAHRLVATIGATGVCAVEFFRCADGRLLLNEMALRPHNSGHATIEASATSQFHQHLRAVLDWPLGSTELHSAAAMVNIIGVDGLTDPADRLPDALRIPGIHVHLYQKSPRPGRKLGHVSALAATTDEALERARVAAAALTGR